MKRALKVFIDFSGIGNKIEKKNKSQSILEDCEDTMPQVNGN